MRVVKHILCGYLVIRDCGYISNPHSLLDGCSICGAVAPRLTSSDLINVLFSALISYIFLDCKMF